MKKIIVILLMLICIFSLSSCDKDPEAYDMSSENTQIAKDWLGNIGYSTEAFNDYKEEGAHYRGFLPTTIDENVLRLNYADASDMLDSKFDKILINYASTSDVSRFSNDFVNDLADLIEDNLELKNIMNAFNAKVINQWSISYYPENLSTPQEDEILALYTVYLPVRVEYYVSQNSSIEKVLTSYIICPIIYGVAIYKNDMFINTLDVVNEIDKITFSVSDGKLK